MYSYIPGREYVEEEVGINFNYKQVVKGLEPKSISHLILQKAKVKTLKLVSFFIYLVLSDLKALTEKDLRFLFWRTIHALSFLSRDLIQCPPVPLKATWGCRLYLVVFNSSGGRSPEGSMALLERQRGGPSLQL